VALGTLALAVCGCTTLHEYIDNCFKVGPNYKRPPAPVAARWIDANDVRVRSVTEDTSRWWKVFNDPFLNALILTAYEQNLTLREAGFRVLEARAQWAIAVGTIFPQTQQMGGSFAQQGLSVEVANRGFVPERWYPQWNYGFTLAWELDFWGRFRRAIESAEDNLNGFVENYDDVLVTLLSDVASTYVQLRTFEQQLVYVRANVELQRQSLGIAQTRFKDGATSELDPDQAQSTLSQTEAQIPQLEIQIRQANNQLCILLGIPPEDLTARLGTRAIPTAPPDVAVGMPADLLRRRPDVRRQERFAAAQCAQIGVAEAEFYPAISINGSLGWSAKQFGDLFNSKAFEGGIGPAFQWPILNYGRILNNVRGQEAHFQELVASYQNTVLRAQEEVENGIVQFLQSQRAVQYLTESVAADERAVKVVLAQYKAGLVDFNRVSVVEQNLVVQQNQLAQAQGAIALGLIQVYRGLGGGWQIRCEKEPPPDTAATPGPQHAPATTQEVLPQPQPVKKPNT
jgi:NodT family efflux transporter outer membrane factor (OMF) lipoprotein